MTSVRAMFFDVFGTLVDWRSGVAREAERLLQPLGYNLDWTAFADAWRAEYQPGMEEVRSGRVPFSKLDVLHRRNLERFMPRFGMRNLPDEVLRELTLAWHRLDAWPDVPAALKRLRKKFLLAPVSNGNISLMVDLAPAECMMVAAHSSDLAAAATCCLRTGHVARPDEYGPGTGETRPTVPVDAAGKNLSDLADKLGA